MRPLTGMVVWRVLVLTLALVVGVVGPAVADDAAPSPPPAPAEPVAAPPATPTAVEQRVARLLERRRHDARIGSDLAMLVLDAHSGAVIAAHRSSQSQQPASNMKLVTAVAALAAMGPGVRFPTAVLASTGTNHITLRAGGDPLLTRSGLADLARQVAPDLSRRATVSVHLDDDLFPAPSDAPGWAPRTATGSVAPVRALGIAGDRGRNAHRHAVDVFAGALRARGFRVRVGTDRNAPPDAPVLARLGGHSVADAVSVMLSRSESSVAEVLHRHVARRLGRPATWAGAERATNEVMRTLGLDPAGQRFADGSGLSRSDRLSPWFLARLLQVASVQQPEVFRVMFRPSAMPVAGRSGTLAARFGRYTSGPSRCAVGRVQAKTGTIPGTIALSGTILTVDGRLAVFSMIVNHRPRRVAELSTRRALDELAATASGCWR